MIYLRHNERYWNGKIGSFKDGSNIFFVTTPDIRQAKDFGTEENALAQLEWWCVQCGADPKEWVMGKYTNHEEPRRFCEEIKKPQDYTFIPEHNCYSKLEENPGGGWSVTISWVNPNAEVSIPDGIFPRFSDKYTPPSMQRTLTQICKDADTHFDDSARLFDLIQEVKGCDLSQSHADFALEYINQKVEELKDKLRKHRARNKFEED